MNKWIRGTNATVVSIAVVGIFIIVTLFLNSMKGIQFDLTTNKKYSLSEQTISVLGKLDRDIKVTLFTGGGSTDEGIMYRDIRDLLNEYKKRSVHILFEEVNPNLDPAKAQQYGIDQAGTIVFQMGEKQKKVYSYELFMAGQVQGSYNFMGESRFTQSIMNMITEERHPIYFLTGHNEMPAAQMTMFRTSLEGENYEIKDLNLYREGQVPEDALAVFILGPQTDLDPKEVALLKEYVQGKGKLFIAVGYSSEMANMPNLDELLATVNVKNEKAVVIETGRTLYNNPLTIVPDIQFHTITNDLADQNRVVVMPVALALSVQATNTEWKANSLLKSTSRAYGETDVAQLTASDPKQDAHDPKGPLDMAFAVMDKDNKPKAIVLGNVQFLQDQVIYEQGNRDFALNSVNWMQEFTDQLTIRPREEAALQQAFIMPNKAKMILYGTIVIFPLAILALGAAIWLRRRKG